MSRGLLMALLALNLAVLAGSGYFTWTRVQADFFSQPPRAQTPAPAVPPTEKPEMPQQASTPPAAPTAAPADVLAGEKRKILFKYRDSVPKRVAIVGDFNHWSPQLMQKDKNHNWTAVLRLAPGEYAYNFIVDGKMIRDPRGKKTKKAGQKILSSLLIVQPQK